MPVGLAAGFDVAQALGLVEAFADIFSIRTQASIAEMERHELTLGKRARRSPAVKP